MSYNLRSVGPCIALAILVVGCAHQKSSLVQSTPKLEILNKQINLNTNDAQAYSNRGYTLALLGRKAELMPAAPRQLALALDHAESLAREDFLSGPSNAPALASMKP